MPQLQPNIVVATGAVKLSSQRAEMIAQKKAEAMQRKMKKHTQREALPAQAPADNEDPFGFGTNFDERSANSLDVERIRRDKRLCFIIRYDV